MQNENKAANVPEKAEEISFRAHADWERTFDAVPDLIAIIDTQHRIVRVNKAMASRLGVSPQQCVGLKCHSVVHGTDEPLACCPHSQLLRDESDHAAELHEDRLGGDFLITLRRFATAMGNWLDVSMSRMTSPSASGSRTRCGGARRN